jgi:ABC-type branched-subunit amino acid transport system substrate-binding protein
MNELRFSDCLRAGTLVLAGALAAAASHPVLAEIGIGKDVIRVGGVMDLQGDSRGLGLGMKAGIEAAFRGRTVKGRRVELVTLNDSYSPPKTVEATQRLVRDGVFAMIGNVGTPTAKVSLPILAEHGVPAVGFFTGAGLLRPGVGDVLNMRASYVQETAAVIESALDAGLKPSSVCAFVQNDAYGMAGVEGIRRALAGRNGTEEVTEKLLQIIKMSGTNPARNELGPVGVYRRNTLFVRDGYESLKSWESASGSTCRLVVSVGTYEAITRMVAYSRYRGDRWVVSAVSFTGADNFRVALKEHGVDEGVIMTQVVPPLDADLRIVAEARKALGKEFGYVSLEGYIVGRLFIDALERVEGNLTREGFLAAVRGQTFDVGGFVLDYDSDNQGSDFVSLTYLGPDGYRIMSSSDWVVAQARN